MAMLAESRQRKRYNLVPKGKPLYEDENRFGTKMLEKMGWKKGQGLGADESGSKDFVRIRYKNDILGLGFKKRDDQWTQHEQSFNGLLKTLNGEENSDSKSNADNGNGNESDNSIPPGIGFGYVKKNIKHQKLKDCISGVSLEEKSKKSKARVHYKKFTKGKDISQYSEKDLANIFGKKALDEHQAGNNFFEHLNNTFGNNYENSKCVSIIKNGMEDNEKPEIGVDVSDNSVDKNEVQLKENYTKIKMNNDTEEINENGANKGTALENNQIIFSNVSMNDYFKIKMEKIKNRKKNNLNTGEKNIDNEDNCDERKVTESSKKKIKDNDLKDFESENELEPKRKKLKKNKINQQNNINNEKEIEALVEIKKQKKNKKIDAVEAELSIDETLTETVEKKKRKKSKHLDAVQAEVSLDETINKTAEVNKQKKSKKLNAVKAVQNQEESKKLDALEAELSLDETKKKKDKYKNKLQSDKSNQDASTKKRKINNSLEKISVSENLLETFVEIDSIQELIKTSTENSSTKKKKINALEKKSSSANLLEKYTEKDLTLEPTEKKSKPIEITEIIEINDSDENELQIDKEKNKSTIIEESSEISVNVDKSSVLHPSENVSDSLLSKKHQKARRKNVSCTAKNTFKSDVNFALLDLEEIKQKYNAFNLYPVSSFCAEKFRNVGLNNFTGSTLSQIEGYSLDSEVKLDVHISKKDEERITNLWKSSLNKYAELDCPKKTYKSYVNKVISARKTKQKRPKLYVKTWKRKNAFQVI